MSLEAEALLLHQLAHARNVARCNAIHECAVSSLLFFDFRVQGRVGGCLRKGARLQAAVAATSAAHKGVHRFSDTSTAFAPLAATAQARARGQGSACAREPSALLASAHVFRQLT